MHTIAGEDHELALYVPQNRRTINCCFRYKTRHIMTIIIRVCYCYMH